MIKTYKTGKKKLFFITAALSVVFISTVALLCYAYIYNKKISTFVPPEADTSAEQGVPEDVPEELSFASLRTLDGKVIAACARPKAKDGKALLYVTNYESNNAVMVCEIYDKKNNNLLGKSGLIEPGQYTKSIPLTSNLEEDIEINIKIVSFAPETYYSEGNINLSTTLTVA